MAHIIFHDWMALGMNTPWLDATQHISWLDGTAHEHIVIGWHTAWTHRDWIALSMNTPWLDGIRLEHRDWMALAMTTWQLHDWMALDMNTPWLDGARKFLVSEQADHFLVLYTWLYFYLCYWLMCFVQRITVLAPTVSLRNVLLVLMCFVQRIIVLAPTVSLRNVLLVLMCPGPVNMLVFNIFIHIINSILILFYKMFLLYVKQLCYSFNWMNFTALY